LKFILFVDVLIVVLPVKVPPNLRFLPVTVKPLVPPVIPEFNTVESTDLIILSVEFQTSILSVPTPVAGVVNNLVGPEMLTQVEPVIFINVLLIPKVNAPVIEVSPVNTPPSLTFLPDELKPLVPPVIPEF
jgi:hypothetical protein